MRILVLSAIRDDYGVYSTQRGRRGPLGTYLLFRGTLDECVAWRKERSR